MLALLLAPAPARPQSARDDGPSTRTAASRKELDSLLVRADALAADPATPESRRAELRRYCADLRSRMQDGDFRPGDRILIAVTGESALSDTFTVQQARVLQLPSLPTISLKGVLRSELEPFLAARFREYVRDTLMRATPLIRIGVLGAVAHPGYFRVPLEMTLGDALMVAGGPTPEADLTRLSIRRGDATLLAPRATRDAMVRGRPLGDLGIDTGDELLLVGPRRRDWTLVTQIVGVMTGLALGLRALQVF